MKRLITIMFILTLATLGHAQVKELAAVGYPGNKSFTDQSVDIKAVRVWYGRQINAVQLKTKTKDFDSRGRQTGSSALFQLKAGEYITRITGTYGNACYRYITSLQIHTNLRSSKTYGRSFGGRKFEFEIPSGSTFAGFKGEYGTELNRLGVLYKKQYTSAKKLKANKRVYSRLKGAL